MKNNPKHTLLYVEDDLFIRDMVIDYLEDYFSIIHVASNGEEALIMYAEHSPSIIISDIKMPKMNGLEFASKVREYNKNIPILITTAYTTTEYLLEAVELHLVKYLVKPVKEEDLQKALTSCFNALEDLNPSIISLPNDYAFDMFSSILTHNHAPVFLTFMQAEFLHLLLMHKDRAVEYREIAHALWKEKVMSDAALRCLVRDIRKIIHKDIITNVSKKGYQINLNG
jgi:DNA-binding response OmpR family regulator